MYKGRDIYEIAIIGAGASGLMLASSLKNRKTCIIETNDKIAQKIKVSGGAKCNITNSLVTVIIILVIKILLKSIKKFFKWWLT